MPDLTPSDYSNIPDNKVHGANMGPTWVLSAPDGPHIGPMNLAIWDAYFFGVADTYALHAGTTPENCAGVSH